MWTLLRHGTSAKPLLASWTADTACQRPDLRQVSLQLFALPRGPHNELMVTLKTLLKSSATVE